MLWKGKHCVWLGVVIAACSLGKYPEEEPADGSGGTERNTESNQPSSSNSSRSNADAGVPLEYTPSSPPQSTQQGDCAEGATRSCGPDSAVGNCRLGKSTCKGGVWSACDGAVLPGPRDCSSAADNDCDGRPDNTVDETCRCAQGATEPCDTHPGFDGNPPCKAGLRSCVLSADKLSSDWGACTGAVAPAAKDSCAVAGDDSNCDGTPNGGCPCVEGETVDCGPSATVGLCKVGKSTCHNNQLGACVGAVLAAPRNCGSSEDNDCDGTPDNESAACTCVVNDTKVCGEHPGLDGNGACHAGVQTCELANGGTSSAFGACLDSVGPAARNCSSTEDNDCNGTPDTSDSTCGCTLGEEAECNTSGLGNCRAGTQVCVAGPGGGANVFGPCTANAAPQAADTCTAGDDANCNGKANEGCTVITP